MADIPAFQSRSSASPATGLKPGSTLGRFELRRQLRQGARSIVWLAYDPRMEREVAIQVLLPSAEEQGLTQWLQKARSVVRVKHPSIVPVYEADIHAQLAFLVSEYVIGDTLAQVLARKGALAAPEAVALMLDVLDAMAVAHGEGVVHGDLTAERILVDTSGRARIMDFGMGARSGSDGVRPSPATDLFACGLLLAEMLLGKPLVEAQEAGNIPVMHRLSPEPLSQGLAPDLDDGLRAIVNRALAQEPGPGFGDARAFFEALSDWRQPGAAQLTAARHVGGTLEFLMRRMRHKSDFPALSESVVRIQSMATSDTESVSSVTNQILKDVALTNKLLRVVNSAHYAHSGSINTVSRAVSLVGFNGIRNMALSLVLLEHMQDKFHAAQLQEEFIRSLLAGTVGAELCVGSKEAEEAFIGAMFQNMGRLLTQFYFPQEAQDVRKLLRYTKTATSEASASHQVLGLSFEDLGIGIAKAWGLPESIQKCMRHPVGGPPASLPTDGTERMRWVASASNEIADVLLRYEAQEVAPQLERVARKYAKALGISEKGVSRAVEQAKIKLVEMALAMDIRVAPDSAAHKLLHCAPPVPDVQIPGSIQALELQATPALSTSAVASTGKSSQVAEILTAGIQDITNAMVEDFKLADVLRMILEAMFRAMGLDRIIFCMRDPKTETITGRFGLGDGVEAHVKSFKVALKAATPDLFGLVCIKGVDSMVSDSSDVHILQRLPDWYLQSLNAPAFLLLPLQIKGAPFGLIYADTKRKGALELDEKELGLLRTLRNQAIMAFKQSR